jgi:hypothetical protein
MRRLLGRLAAPFRRRRRVREVRRAAADWRQRREELKATFLEFARASGKPHDLRWAGCEWNGPVRLAREQDSGLLTAFAAIVVRFEAIEGGEMEEAEAVGLPRDAAAVFQFHDGWRTSGQALFNMTPAESIARLGDQVTPVDPAGEEFPV